MIPVLRAWRRSVIGPAIYGHCVHALVGDLWMRASSFIHLPATVLIAFGILVVLAFLKESLIDRDLQQNLWNGVADVLAFVVVAGWDVHPVVGAAADVLYVVSVHLEGRRLPQTT